jgi:hypothetical protein
MEEWVGIDFSGSNPSWSPRTSRSNVWICILRETRRNQFRLIQLDRLQDFFPSGPLLPVQSLANFLEAGSFTCAAIDAPFSLPAVAMPKQGFLELLKEVRALKIEEGRWIPRGHQLIEIAQRRIPSLEDRGSKRYPRLVEKEFSASRTPLWGGPRPGAPFTVACLWLLANANVRHLWGGEKDASKARVVEAYPAGQLAHWRWPSKNYDGMKGDAPQARKSIVQKLKCSWSIEISDQAQFALEASADALDSLICAFAARAASMGIAEKLPAIPQNTEGWISIHPPP